MECRFALRLTILAALVMLCSACSRSAEAPAPDPTAATPSARVAAASTDAPADSAANDVRMIVDGVPWIADREFVCMVDPPGLGRQVIVAASLGPKDRNEQAFNLNLSGIDGPGTIELDASGLGDLSVVHTIQLANLDAERALNGGAMGFDVRIEVLALASDPARVEARFAGTLNSTRGTPLAITDGYLRCRE